MGKAHTFTACISLITVQGVVRSVYIIMSLMDQHSRLNLWEALSLNPSLMKVCSKWMDIRFMCTSTVSRSEVCIIHVSYVLQASTVDIGGHWLTCTYHPPPPYTPIHVTYTLDLYMCIELTLYMYIYMYLYIAGPGGVRTSGQW